MRFGRASLPSAAPPIRRVNHAYELLTTGERIVAIANDHGFFSSDAKSVAFRERLCSLDNVHDEELPDDRKGHLIPSQETASRNAFPEIDLRQAVGAACTRA
ncbi:MAG: hypothetical protein L0228_05290 [Planctomycetes bacterium]|nr:hypothetical protein [Planctomycetota bacterium]